MFLVDRISAKDVLPPVCVALAAFLAFRLDFYSALDFAERNAVGGDYAIIARNLAMPLSIAYLPDATEPFAYPPTTAILLWPLRWMQSQLGYIVFTVAGAACLALICRRYLTPVALFLMLISFPLVNVALLGQPGFLVVALTLAGLAARDRRLAGIAFAVGAGIKPQLLALVPIYLLATRDWRAFMWAGGGYALIVLLSVAAFGLEAWRMWPNTIENYRAIILNGEVIRWVVTPIGMAERSGLTLWPVYIVCGLAALALPLAKYSDPIEALFGVTLAALMILPYGCPDNLLGLMPMAAREIARGRVAPILPFTLWFAPAATFGGIALALQMNLQIIKRYIDRGVATLPQEGELFEG